LFFTASLLLSSLITHALRGVYHRSDLWPNWLCFAQKPGSCPGGMGVSPTSTTGASACASSPNGFVFHNCPLPPDWLCFVQPAPARQPPNWLRLNKSSPPRYSGFGGGGPTISGRKLGIVSAILVSPSRARNGSPGGEGHPGTGQSQSAVSLAHEPPPPAAVLIKMPAETCRFHKNRKYHKKCFPFDPRRPAGMNRTSWAHPVLTYSHDASTPKPACPDHGSTRKPDEPYFNHGPVPCFAR